LKANTPKQQQLVDQLQQQFSVRCLDPVVWLALPELVTSLQDISAAQHQPGLVTLLKELQGLHDGRLDRLEQATPEAVLRLVAGLQLEGQFRSDANYEQLHEKLLESVRRLWQPNAGQAASAAAGGAAPLAGGVSLPRKVLCQFSLQELAALAAAVMASRAQHQQSSATNGTGASSAEPPHGSAELSVTATDPAGERGAAANS